MALLGTALLGIRPRDLPEDWRASERIFAETVDARREHTVAVDEVLDALAHPSPPALDPIGAAGWALARAPLGRAVRLATVGLLPRRCASASACASRAPSSSSWARSRTLRAATPLMPPWLRNTGPGYLRWRRDAAERL